MASSVDQAPVLGDRRTTVAVEDGEMVELGITVHHDLAAELAPAAVTLADL